MGIGKCWQRPWEHQVQWQLNGTALLEAPRGVLEQHLLGLDVVLLVAQLLLSCIGVTGWLRGLAA